MNLYEKLSLIQTQMSVPKKHHNDFGDFWYRSCEDILDAFKPIGAEHQVVLMITDKIEEKNGDNYVTATAKLINLEKPEEFIEASASAREDKAKGKMDASQMTGSASSYARKYALNGLFLLDDNKDPDDMKPDEKKPESKRSNYNKDYKPNSNGNEKASEKQIAFLKKVYKDQDLLNLLFSNNISKIEDLPRAKASSLIEQISKRAKENKKND